MYQRFVLFQIVLSACSTYFDAIFSQHEEKNPIVILKDVKFSDIKALVEFMYKGEINVDNVSDFILETVLLSQQSLQDRLNNIVVFSSNCLFNTKLINQWFLLPQFCQINNILLHVDGGGVKFVSLV